MSEVTPESRVRIRRLTHIKPNEIAKVRLSTNYWAWSRMHVAEQIDRLAAEIRSAHRHGGVGLGAHQIHMHKISGLEAAAARECTESCLHVDSVLATLELSEDELERGKVA